MTPVMCHSAHRPPERYGDCLRACVASILELDAREVPHFFERGDEAAGNELLHTWLSTHGYYPFVAQLPGSLSDVFDFMRPNGHYILMGRTDDGPHAVVCCGGAEVHNPHWFGSPLVGPLDNGFWTVLIIAVGPSA